MISIDKNVINKVILKHDLETIEGGQYVEDLPGEILKLLEPSSMISDFYSGQNAKSKGVQLVE